MLPVKVARHVPGILEHLRGSGIDRDTRAVLSLYGLEGGLEGSGRAPLPFRPLFRFWADELGLSAVLLELVAGALSGFDVTLDGERVGMLAVPRELALERGYDPDELRVADLEGLRAGMEGARLAVVENVRVGASVLAELEAAHGTRRALELYAGPATEKVLEALPLALAARGRELGAEILERWPVVREELEKRRAR